MGSESEPQCGGEESAKRGEQTKGCERHARAGAGHAATGRKRRAACKGAKEKGKQKKEEKRRYGGEGREGGERSDSGEGRGGAIRQRWWWGGGANGEANELGWAALNGGRPPQGLITRG